MQRNVRGWQVNSTVPQFNGSPVSDKPENGGKRKGRTMKKRPRTFKRGSRVTVENLRNGRANNGYYNGDLDCVVYYRD